ncbi:MAG: VOC family protein [Emcibacter sp.]|nr:VOC family protein [Emcibacter sp.]
MSLKLAYVGIETNKQAEWAQFAEVIGFQYEKTGDVAYLRMDEKERRIILMPGGKEDYVFSGLEADSKEEFDVAVARLKNANVKVGEGSREGAEIRAVEQYVSFVDPAGITVELAYGCKDAATRFESPFLPDGFVTGNDIGIGHLAFIVPDYKKCEQFYLEAVGATLSDHIFGDLNVGGRLDLTFLHFNPRHHSLAFGSVFDAPAPVAEGFSQNKLQHYMCEYHEVRDVLRALDRVKNAGIPITMSLGEHPNDLAVSFYCLTPSGFWFEVAAGCISIDDEIWVPSIHKNFSNWGHDILM